MVNENKLFGVRIRRLREANGWTQEYFAERIDISSNYLSSIERGRENPTFNMAVRLSLGLGVEMRELFDFGHEANVTQLRNALKKFATQLDEKNLRLVVKVVRALTR